MKRLALILALASAACSDDPTGYRRIASVTIEDIGIQQDIMTPVYDERHMVALDVVHNGEARHLLDFTYDGDHLMSASFSGAQPPTWRFKWRGDQPEAIINTDQYKWDIVYDGGQWVGLDVEGKPYQRLHYEHDRLARVEHISDFATQVVDVVRDGSLVTATNADNFESTIVYDNGVAQALPEAGFSVTYNSEGLVETITSPGQGPGRVVTYAYDEGEFFGLRPYPAFSFGTGPGPLFDMDGTPRAKFEVMSIDLTNSLRTWGVY